MEDVAWKYYQVCEQIAHLNELKAELEAEILKEVGLQDWQNDLDAGASNFKINDHADLKITRSNKFAVDQDKASKLSVDCWRVKYELDKRKFDELPDFVKSEVEKLLTIKPNKPIVKINLK